jgi:hypothetical protein
MKQRNSTPSNFHFPDWLDWKILILIILILAGVVWLTTREPGVDQDMETQIRIDATSGQPIILDTPTPIPPELLANREQTIGIVLGGVVLVLIIVGGTASAITRNGKR